MNRAQEQNSFDWLRDQLSGFDRVGKIGVEDVDQPVAALGVFHRNQ